MQLSVRTDRQLLRAHAESVRYILVSLVAPTALPRDGRNAGNIGIILDRSGSMDGARKFELARQAVEQSLGLLQPSDRFTLVAYDEQVDTLVAPTLATAEAKRLAMHRLSNIGPRGSTDLHAGWATATGQMLPHVAHDTVNRALLITDGLANHGVTAHAELARCATDLRMRGISTSTFGVGDDFDERLLRDIAHEGGGNFYFVETAAQISDMLTSELGEALEVVLHNAALTIALPDGAVVTALNRYRSTHGVQNLRVELGDITSSQELQLVLRLQFPTGAEGSHSSVVVSLAGNDDGLQSECEVTWRYASLEENDLQTRDRTVDRAVATLYSARARSDATEANRNADLERARSVLMATARRIQGYANGDPELEELSRALMNAVDDYAVRPMSAAMLKSSFALAENAVKHRDPDGKARRRARH